MTHTQRGYSVQRDEGYANPSLFAQATYSTYLLRKRTAYFMFVLNYLAIIIEKGNEEVRLT